MNTKNWCEICHTYHEDTITLPAHGTEYTVCQSCADKFFKRSTYSGTWVHWPTYKLILEREGVGPWIRRQLLKGYGTFITYEDYRDGQKICEVCSLPSDYRFIQEVSVEGEDLEVCDECFSELYEGEYVQCECCEKWYDRDYDEGYTVHNGHYVCNGCYQDSYVTCEDCGEVYNENSDRISYSDRRQAWLCEACWDSEYDSDYADDPDRDPDDLPYINSYGYKPKGKFYSTEEDSPGSTLYMGVENEFSHDDWDELEEHSEYIKRRYNLDEYESHFYQKADSSLENGVEVVSHPMSLSYWQNKMREHLTIVFKGSREYTSGNSDGLHIHISRGGMNKSHRFKFAAFFEMCRTGVELIARRGSNSYAEFLPYSMVHSLRNKSSKKLMYDLSRNAGGRYRVVNWQNERTAEVRIFKSTLDVGEFFAALEFTHAAYQFTKRIGWHTMHKAWVDGVLWDMFLNFAAEDKRYLDIFGAIEHMSRMGNSSNDVSTGSDDSAWLEYHRPPFEKLDTFLDNVNIGPQVVQTAIRNIVLERNPNVCRMEVYRCEEVA